MTGPPSCLLPLHVGQHRPEGQRAAGQGEHRVIHPVLQHPVLQPVLQHPVLQPVLQHRAQ